MNHSTRRKSLFASVMSLLLGTHAPADAALADAFYVRLTIGTADGHRSGQGVLFRWREVCFALTAGHVLDGQTEASVLGGHHSPVEGTGLLLRRFDDEDLALLRVTGAVADRSYCSLGLSDLRANASQLARGSGRGRLAFVEASGRVQFSRVDIPQPGEKMMAVRASDSLGTGLAPGQSGSLVLMESNSGAGDVAVGILVKILDGSKAAMLSTQHAVSVVERWLQYPDAPAAVHENATWGTKNSGGAPQVPDGKTQSNLLDRRRGAALVQRVGLPHSVDTGTDRLIDDPPGSWVTRILPNGATYVDLQLAGSEQGITLGCVLLEPPVGQPVARWASEVHVHFSMTGEAGSWEPFGRALQANADGHPVAIRAGEVRARYVRLVLAKNYRDPDWVALGRVRAYASARLSPCA